MAIECIVITGVFVVIAVLFFRRKRIDWALAVLPLTLVPLTDFVLEFIVTKVFKAEVTAYGGIIAIVVAVAFSAAWIGASSMALKHKSTTATYIAITNAFNVALAAILINTILKNAGELESLI